MTDDVARSDGRRVGRREEERSAMSSNQRLRMEATESEASVTPLELFFDLVFVFGLTQVTSLVRRGTGPDPSRRRERLHPRQSDSRRDRRR
jgi:hypothetical protein